jgi:zeaxanthin glucosyltransferase
MSHFAIVCPPISGHLDPLAAMGRSLIRRGHRVTVFHVPDVEPKVRSQGLGFVPLGADRFPPGTLPASVAKLAALHGPASLKFAVRCACDISEAILDTGPAAFSSAGVDVVLVDQNEPAGASVAEYLGLPFLSACTSLPLNREPSIPPPFVGWPYRPDRFGQLRNKLGFVFSDRFIAPLQKTLNRYRALWNLPPLRTPDDSFSPFAQIAQMPRSFDFPRRALPDAFHYLGPWFDDHSSRIPFPFEKLDGRPIIYGSIGTLQQARSDKFRIMAEACSGLEAQLVVSLGQPEAKQSCELPGNPIVVNYAPQIEILRRAAVTITHAGLNTTQQALYFGVPMVAIPLTHDQPAIAARVAWTEAGIVIPPKSLSTERLRTALRRLLPRDNPYRQAALRIGRESQAAGGVEAAADIAVAVLQKRTQPAGFVR